MSAKMFVDATHRALQHLTDLARFDATEVFPRELLTVRAIGAVQEDHVQVRIEPQVR